MWGLGVVLAIICHCNAVPLIAHRTRNWITCLNIATSEPSVKRNTRVLKMTSKEFGERIWDQHIIKIVVVKHVIN